MIGVGAPRLLDRQEEPRAGQAHLQKALAVARRQSAPAQVPGGEPPQLDAQDGRLQRVEPAVVPLLRVHVLLRLPVVAQPASPRDPAARPA